MDESLSDPPLVSGEHCPSLVLRGVRFVKWWAVIWIPLVVTSHLRAGGPLPLGSLAKAR